MNHERSDADARELAEEAAEWLSVLETASNEERAVFVGWLKKSSRHVEETLRMMELDAALSVLLPRRPVGNAEPKRYAAQRFLTLSEAKTDFSQSLPKRVNTYRRAIIQVLIQRRIDRDSAEDLFQELWLQMLEDGRLETLTDSEQLGTYLYRAACERAVAYRGGELSWIGHHRPSAAGVWQADEPSALEVCLGYRQLARCTRDLLLRVPITPDRKVLECFFLHPEPNGDVRQVLNLSEIELGQAVWRTRQQFGEIIRERGVNLCDPEVQHAGEIQRAAMYVANALRSREDERAFELQMIWFPRCAAEVDVWRALKRGMVRAESDREVSACG